MANMNDIKPKTQFSVKPNENTKIWKQDLADWFYLPTWKQTLPLAPVEKGALIEQGGCWLLFLPNGANGLGARLAERLADESQVVAVYPGESFSQLGNQYFTIRPGHPDDYEALVNALGGTGCALRQVVHFWNTPWSEPASFEQIQEAGFYSLLFLAQAIGLKNLSTPVQLTLVTSGAQQVVDTETIRPAKATALGLCKVIPQEYANIFCRTIDVTLPTPGKWQEARLVEQLLAECVTGNPTDQVIAYRGRQRWVQAFEATQLEGSAKTLLREEGVYLVTGGLGNVGFGLAQGLAKNVRARLALVGRTTMPARKSWANWLANHDEQDATSCKIRMVETLENLGAQVMIASADVADPAEMQRVVTEARSQFGTIHGVIHAAGIIDRALLRTIKDTGLLDVQTHFAAKIHSVQILEELFRGQTLDFCLLTSSLASILGGLELACYAAANSYMDAFVYRHNLTEAVPWMSINWDTWQVATQQYEGISAEEGADALLRILSLPRGAITQAVISTTPLATRLEQWITKDEAPGDILMSVAKKSI